MDCGSLTKVANRRRLKGTILGLVQPCEIENMEVESCRWGETDVVDRPECVLVISDIPPLGRELGRLENLFQFQTERAGSVEGYSA